MKKTIVILLAALMVSAIGCQKKEETAKAPAPPVAAQTVAPQPAAPQAVEPKPLHTAGSTANSQPHTHPSAPLRAVTLTQT